MLQRPILFLFCCVKKGRPNIELVHKGQSSMVELKTSELSNESWRMNTGMKSSITQGTMYTHSCIRPLNHTTDPGLEINFNHLQNLASALRLLTKMESLLAKIEIRTFLKLKVLSQKNVCGIIKRYLVLLFKIEVSFVCWESLLHRYKFKIKFQLNQSSHLDVQSNFVNCNRLYLTV